MRERRRYRAIVIAASTGGIAALRSLLSKLDPALRTPLIIVQHTGSPDASALCELFSRVSPLPVVEALERMRVQPATIYIAPPGYHLLVEKSQSFSLSLDPKVRYVRPSADVLFESAADVWGECLIGIVLTGANDDGARGLQAIRSRKGLAIVQAPDDAEMRDMPAAALAIAGADHVLPIEEIGPLLNRLCLRDAQDAPEDDDDDAPAN